MHLESKQNDACPRRANFAAWGRHSVHNNVGTELHQLGDDLFHVLLSPLMTASTPHLEAKSRRKGETSVAMVLPVPPPGRVGAKRGPTGPAPRMTIVSPGRTGTWSRRARKRRRLRPPRPPSHRFDTAPALGGDAVRGASEAAVEANARVLRDRASAGIPAQAEARRNHHTIARIQPRHALSHSAHHSYEFMSEHGSHRSFYRGTARIFRSVPHKPQASTASRTSSSC